MKKLLLTTVFVLMTNAAFAACPITDAQGAPVTPNAASYLHRCHKAMEIMYNPATKTPVWVAENRRAEDVRGTDERNNSFRMDPTLPPEVASRDEDYVRARLGGPEGPPLSRGHMAPSSDFRRDEEAQAQSFYLSNAVPQVQKCNNSGVWATIEEMTRDWTVHYGQTYVVTGPIYGPNPQRIGSGVAVPDAVFKVIYNPVRNQSLAFIVPNVELCKSRPRDFATTQDEVERVTGLEFFPNLSGYGRTDQIWP